jgi:hypothetical protein
MNRPAIIASAFAVAAFGCAIWQHAVVCRADVTIERLNGESGRLQNELSNVKQRLEAASQRMVQAELQSASLKDDLSQLFSKKDAAASVTANARSQPTFMVGGYRRGGPLSLRSMPPIKALDTTYHVLYRQLKLSAAQIEQFKTVMTEAATRFEDLAREAKKKQVRTTDPTMQPLYAKADSELREKLTVLVGAEAVPVMEHFTETLFLRDGVAQLATELFYTNSPLTEPQANQLVDILAKNMRDPAGRLNSAFADASAMKADAEKVLSPPQLVVWGELIDFLVKTSFASLNPLRR